MGEKVNGWAKSLFPAINLDLLCGPTYRCAHGSWLHSGQRLEPYCLLPSAHRLLSFLSLILRQLPKGYIKTSVQGPPRLSIVPSLNKLSTNSDAKCHPSSISSHVTYFSHTTQLCLWTSHSHSDYHLVSKQNLSSLGWIREEMSVNEGLPLPVSLQLIRYYLIQANFLQKWAERFSRGTSLWSQSLEGEFSFIKPPHIGMNHHCKIIGLCLTLQIYKTRITSNHWLCHDMLANFNIFHNYTLAKTNFKMLA